VSKNIKIFINVVKKVVLLINSLFINMFFFFFFFFLNRFYNYIINNKNMIDGISQLTNLEEL